MPSLQYGVSVSGLGSNITQLSNRTGDGGAVRAVSIAAGSVGTVATQTSTTAGVLTLPTGHGITTSDTIDVYWSGGRLYSAVVTAATSTTVTFDDALGDSVPVATTPIVACIQTTITFALTPSELVIFAAQMSFLATSEVASSHVEFVGAASAQILSLDLPANGTPFVNDVFGGASNAFSGAVLTVVASNGSALGNPATLNLVTVIDSSST